MKVMRASANRPVFAAVVAGLVASCATYQPRPLAPEQSAADFAARSLDDPGLRRFVETNSSRAIEVWPPLAWDFSTLMLVALYFAPDLDMARAQWATARAGRLTAGQRPNPVLSLQPGYDTTTSPPWILGASLDVPIETAGKRRYRTAEASHRSEVARLNIGSVAWQVRSRLRRSLLDWDGARESVALLRGQESNLVASVRLLESQLAAGAIAAFTVTEARLALGQTRFAVYDAAQRQAVARLEVAGALGLPAHALEQAVFDLRELRVLPAEPAEAASRRQAVLNRIDLRIVLAEYAAADASLRLQLAKQYPDLHFNPGYQLDQADNKWTLGLSLELPMRSHNQGPVAEAAARRRELGAKFNALQARVLTEVEQGLAAYRVARGKATAAQGVLADARRQETAARDLVAGGEMPLLELVRRQVESSAAALVGLDAAVAAQQALGALEDALRSPVPPSGAVELEVRGQTPSSKP
jgi:outer membrane protein TolC